MDNNYTHINVILDRTGSMGSIRDDIIGGFNTFIKEQINLPGKATLSLIQFDTQDPFEVIYNFAPIGFVAELTRETYVPRAGTPLLDAMGRGINDLEKSLNGILEEADKPAKVVFVTITDGQENSSREFKRDQIMKMIQEKQERENWQFVFLSADLNSINEALDLGFQPQKVMSFDHHAEGSKHAWDSMSEKMALFRGKETLEYAFDDKDRAKQDSERKRANKP